MAKETRRFRCPCCHEELEFDPASGKARRVDALQDGDSAAALAELVAKQKREAERLGDMFSRAADDVATQANRFDDLLSGALEEAKKEKGKKPPNPFDLE